ncbi:MAG TPA: hypothetical protein PKN22_08415 [Taishania sp.]|nr:hypothetical protein [Taishania sp.]
MMNRAFLLLFLGFSMHFTTHSQVFYFNNTSTTLVKTVNQSPAHWYIEIFSNSATDVTLKWKAIFSQIPPQWVINFDDQTVNHTPVNDGDEANFTLFPTEEFPQKLIIGATLNNTPGIGTAAFEISDPNTNYKDTIHYIFHVTDNLSVEKSDITLPYSIKNGVLTIENDLENSVLIYDESGRVIDELNNCNSYTIKDLKKNTLYYIQLYCKQKVYSIKYFNN